MTVWHQEWGCMTLCQHKTILTELKELDLIQFFATMESSLEPPGKFKKHVCFQYTLKRLYRSCANLLRDVRSQGRFMNDQNFKNLIQQNSIFIKFFKILKIHEMFFWNQRFFLQCTRREHVHNRWARNALKA